MTCNTYTKVLAPNEVWVKPKDAKITYISDIVDLVSSCNITDTPSGFLCYQFDYPLQGGDVDTSDPNFYLTSFKFDSYTLNVVPNPLLESGSFENAQQYVDRIANSIWNANNADPNGVIQGVYVAYQNFVDHDKVSIVLRIPSIYKSVIMKYIDIDTHPVDTNNVPADLSSIGRTIDCGFRATMGTGDRERLLGNV